jgi:dethiobiotin synthetase
MSGRFIIAGTDTGVGKTVFAAALTGALRAAYMKPVQSGLEDETDEETVRRLTGLSDSHFIPSVYRLRTPVSPHRSARIDGVTIETARLELPSTTKPLVVEAAGGLLVPLNADTLYIDVMAQWRVPVVLCARTTLGTINHTLLSLEALARRSIPVHGVAFVGHAERDTEETIMERSGVRRLGRLAWLPELNGDGLSKAFAGGFRIEDFE